MKYIGKNPLNISRNEFYYKELELVVHRFAAPGLPSPIVFNGGLLVTFPSKVAQGIAPLKNEIIISIQFMKTTCS